MWVAQILSVIDLQFAGLESGMQKLCAISFNYYV
jgi:hypothetical protein